MRQRLDYWVDLLVAGRSCGAGFLITRRFVLTAAHCLKNRAVEEDIVTMRRGDDQAEARVLTIDHKYDVALLQVKGQLDWPILGVSTANCKQGDQWFVPYRPAPNRSELKGTVSTVAMPFACAGGATIEALELQVVQLSGNYSGYSGSPVEWVLPDGSEERVRAVIGMLIEQEPHRVRRDEYTNVLFASTIAQAMSRFDVFEAPALLDRLDPLSSAHDQAPNRAEPDITHGVKQTFAGLRATIAEIHALVDDGVIPFGEAARLTRESVRYAAQRSIDGSGRG